MNGTLVSQILELVATGGILGIAYAAGQLVKSVRELERRVGNLEDLLGAKRGGRG